MVNNPPLIAVTMYSSLETCDHNCVMADGQKAHEGSAACPRDWSLGTKIKIQNKEFTCEDRTNIKYDGRVDVWAGYGSIAHQVAVNWGIKYLVVEKQ